MYADRRSYSLSKDQPILQQARRRRAVRPCDARRAESEFWKSFDLEKLAAGWGSAAAMRPARESGRAA